MPPERKVNPVVATIIVIVLVVGVTVGILVLQRTSSTTESTVETTTSAPVTETTDADTNTTYTDGEYTATGSYSTPGGTEDITVTVTLADDIVTAVTADGSATSGNSAAYQSEFLDGYKTLVVGKDVDQISLSRVSGSSLTSDGFNKALKAIRADAAA